jgi:poly-gamma-glutamate capsule biosynthesis protein CapA/YwtB (metallophosphatase superfamily)
MENAIRLFLAGDVMTGRGLDQIMKHPGDPTLYEPWVRDARVYVELTETRSGPIPRGVEPDYVWGGALDVLDDAVPDARIINLETAVTDRGSPWPDKTIHYRMHPANIDCLTVARIDVAVLANNHATDWSVPGLEQTIEVLAGAGIEVAGVGRNRKEAWLPATVDTRGRGRVIVLGLGSISSGIPPAWAARERSPGVALLPDLSDCTVDQIAGIVDRTSHPGDVVVASLHWGSNWGYEIPEPHRHFARALIDRAGVDLIHGHSSHHPLGIEVYREHLILYGCGDLLTDYEGIGGHDSFQGELGALYLPTVEPASGKVTRLELVPTKVERFRLVLPLDEDVHWLASLLDQQGKPLGTYATVGEKGRILISW